MRSADAAPLYAAVAREEEWRAGVMERHLEWLDALAAAAPGLDGAWLPGPPASPGAPTRLTAVRDTAGRGCLRLLAEDYAGEGDEVPRACTSVRLPLDGFGNLDGPAALESLGKSRARAAAELESARAIAGRAGELAALAAAVMEAAEAHDALAPARARLGPFLDEWAGELGNFR